ncbi:MAG: DUF2339 domain-containing protein, partial [Candidatus Omnitrophica bacterium]|nr:DUF2339 domain-containing protein [Candidatus Omnitrophota bacterium]
TYAMYHFEASKIISSQLLDLFLLAIVALGIIAHSLRYKSEGLTATTLFIGYFTCALGNVSHFTLVSTALLAVVALVMVYKMQWVRFIFLGIILTYLTHIAWIIKQIIMSRIPVGNLNVENVYFFFDVGFLSIYWLLFIAGVHLIKDKTGVMVKRLAAANFANFLLYFFMTCPKLYYFYPSHKFNVIFGFGLGYLVLALVMDFAKRKELFLSDIIIAVSLLTLSVQAKFLPYHATLIWFIELPFLLLIGFVFERKVYRYLGFALSVFLFCRFISTWWHPSAKIEVFSTTMTWQALLALAGFISTAACFVFYRLFQVKEGAFNYEKISRNFYSGFSVLYLTVYLCEVIKPLWVTFGVSLESLAIFIAGVLLLDKYIRWYALAVLFFAGVGFCFKNNYKGASEWQQVFLIYGPVACAFTEYFIYRKFNKKPSVPQIEGLLAKILFFAAASLLVFAIIVFVQQVWITLSLAVMAVLALLWGVKVSDQYIRLYSLLVLLLVAVRFLFIDEYRYLGGFFQWALIFAKLACVYAAYFIFRYLNKKSRLAAFEKLLVVPLFYLGLILVCAAIFQYVKDIWVAVSLGVFGVLLFTTGFKIKDKSVRQGGFVIFAITLGRIIFVDLAGLPMIYKIISFIILGVIFLGVSFIYNKYSAEKLR